MDPKQTTIIRSDDTGETAFERVSRKHADCQRHITTIANQILKRSQSRFNVAVLDENMPDTHRYTEVDVQALTAVDESCRQCILVELERMTDDSVGFVYIEKRANPEASINTSFMLLQLSPRNGAEQTSSVI